jgi:branched-chain amino acid transport system ATP-binding protein
MAATMVPNAPGQAAADAEPALIELRSVDVAYHGDIRILQDLSLAVRTGRITGVIGPNGAGKSTALRALYGLLKPVAGDVLIDGAVVTGMAPWRFIERGIALVPQSRSLFNELSVEDNLRLACWSFRRDKARVAEALERAYAQFPILKDRRGQYAGAMSGGQQRFLELGRALALQPRAVLLDEPTAMIAPKLASEIYEFIHGLPAMGITVLLVDQNVRQCVRVADHVYVLELGRNKIDGSADDFAHDSALRELIAEWVDYRIDA